MFWPFKKLGARKQNADAQTSTDEPDDIDFFEPPETIEMVIDGVLDLHNFRAKETKTLVPAYLRECLKNNIYEVRIIHGKGTGRLREWVHKILHKDERVLHFRLGDVTQGGYGATIVTLKR